MLKAVLRENRKTEGLLLPFKKIIFPNLILLCTKAYHVNLKKKVIFHLKTNANLLTREKYLMIKRILLGLGGTPYTDVAIDRAVELAKLHGALITGVTVMDTKQLKQVGPIPPGGEAYAAKLRERRLSITEERIDNAIEQFKKKCDESNMPDKMIWTSS